MNEAGRRNFKSTYSAEPSRLAVWLLNDYNVASRHSGKPMPVKVWAKSLVKDDGLATGDGIFGGSRLALLLADCRRTGRDTTSPSFQFRWTAR